MAFEGLAEKLGAAFKNLKSKGRLTEADVKSAMREIRLALLEADVNYKVAKEFTNKVMERAVGTEVMESLTPAQMVVKIVDEELTALMGGEQARLNMASKPPTVFMFCGLQGAGKTTHAGKLAAMLKKQGHRPMLVACDIYRPAAIKQLQVVGSSAGVPVFEQGTEKPVKICRAAIRHARGDPPRARLRQRHPADRHRRPPADRRDADERARGHQKGRGAAGNPAGGRFHDRPGGGECREIV